MRVHEMKLLGNCGKLIADKCSPWSPFYSVNKDRSVICPSCFKSTTASTMIDNKIYVKASNFYSLVHEKLFITVECKNMSIHRLNY